MVYYFLLLDSTKYWIILTILPGPDPNYRLKKLIADRIRLSYIMDLRP